MEITKISAQKKADRFNVYVDGMYWAGISGSVLIKFNLFSGKCIDREFLTQVFEYEIFSKLYLRCVGKLARRPQSTKELIFYMRSVLLKNQKKWFSETVYMDEFKRLSESLVVKVIDKLVTSELLSDKKFAIWWVDNRINHKPMGKIKICQELISKGISADIIESIEIKDETEKVMLERVVQKLSRNKNLSEEKMLSRLKNRGFSWDIIKKVINNRNEVGKA